MKRTVTSSGLHYLKTIAGIPSNPHALWGSSLEMIVENMDAVLCISYIRDSVLNVKLGHGAPDSRKTLQAKYSVLSTEDDSHLK